MIYQNICSINGWNTTFRTLSSHNVLCGPQASLKPSHWCTEIARSADTSRPLTTGSTVNGRWSINPPKHRHPIHWKITQTFEQSNMSSVPLLAHTNRNIDVYLRTLFTYIGCTFPSSISTSCGLHCGVTLGHSDRASQQINCHPVACCYFDIFWSGK